MNCLRQVGECLGALSLPSTARRVGTALFGVLFLACAYVPTARGELITVSFSGTVTSVFVSGGYGLRNFEFPNVGDSFTGFYTFDSNAPDTANSPDVGGFHTALTDTAIGLSIGAFQLEGAATTIGTSRNVFTSSDYYSAADGIPSIELTSNAALALILDRNNFGLSVLGENLFPDPNVLPLTPPSLVGAARGMTMSMDSRFNFTDAPLVIIRASLDTLTAVPEPSALLVAGIVLIFSLRLRRWRTFSVKGLANERR